MADPTPKPLTKAEQTQRDELNSREAASRVFELEQERKIKQENMKAVRELVDALCLEDTIDKLNSTIVSISDPDIIETLLRIRNTFKYDVQGLATMLAALGNSPAVVPNFTPVDTPVDTPEN